MNFNHNLTDKNSLNIDVKFWLERENKGFAKSVLSQYDKWIDYTFIQKLIQRFLFRLNDFLCVLGTTIRYMKYEKALLVFSLNSITGFQGFCLCRCRQHRHVLYRRLHGFVHRLALLPHVLRADVLQLGQVVVVLLLVHILCVRPLEHLFCSYKQIKLRLTKQIIGFQKHAPRYESE